MHLISGENLKKLEPLLLKDPLDYPVVLSILSGAFSGWALADNPDNPSRVLVFHSHCGYMHYFGIPPAGENIKELADAAMAYRSDRDYCHWAEFAHCPPAIADLIEKKHPAMERYSRISWNHNVNLYKAAHRPIIPDGCRISLIDKKDFAIEYIDKKTNLYWNSINDFLNNTIGIKALDDNGKLLGICGSVSASGGYYEINIHVQQDRRKSGIGYAMVRKFISECYKRGEIPHWDCNARNQVSQSLAKKAGFIEAGTYPLVSWEYKNSKS